MAEALNDLFAYFKDENDNELQCESAAAISTGDDFMNDVFVQADLDSYSNYFELSDISFEMEMSPNSSGSASTISGGDEFGDWYMHPELYTQSSGGGNQQNYTVKKINGNFSKVVDSVSPQLFVACCNGATYKKAIIVKRAFTGQAASGAGGLGLNLSASAGLGGLSASASLSLGGGGVGNNLQAMGFVRMEMTDVRFTSVSWDDGDLLTEKVQFQCQTLTIKYKKQHDSGRLDSATPLLEWQARTGSE